MKIVPKNVTINPRSSYLSQKTHAITSLHGLHEAQDMKAPVLFISHGAPTFAVEPGALGPELQRLGKGISGIRAVLVISPHWRTRNVKVMSTPEPATMHD